MNKSTYEKIKITQQEKLLIIKSLHNLDLLDEDQIEGEKEKNHLRDYSKKDS